MAQLTRGDKIDRLVATPAVLDARSGIRLILSSEKRDSTEPAIDDLNKIDKQEGGPKEAGKLHVVMQGVPEDGGQVELLAISPGGGKRTIGKVAATRSAPNPQDIQAQAQFTPKKDMPAHTLRVQVHGGGVDANNPIGGVSVRLVPEAAALAGDLTVGAEQKTTDSGFYDVTETTKGKLVASIQLNGKEMQSQAFDLTNNATCPKECGGVLDVEAHWDTQGKLGADFDVSGVKPDEALVVQTSDVQREDAVSLGAVSAGRESRHARHAVHLSARVVPVQPDVPHRRRVPRGRRQVRDHEQLVGAVHRRHRRLDHPAAEELQRRARRRSGSRRRRGLARRRVPDRQASPAGR